MEHETESIVYDGIVVPESAALKVERRQHYGMVDGLDDEELADPEELERQVFLKEFGPVLALPRDKGTHWLPAVDSSDGIDWGAFGTVDFQRIRPPFDKARYKAEKLREELRHAVIMLSIVKEHVPGRAKYLVMRYLHMGWIVMEDIANEDMRAVAKWYLRVRRLRQEIAELERYSRSRQERRLDALPSDA